jgi:hypothetical protein
VAHRLREVARADEADGDEDGPEGDARNNEVCEQQAGTKRLRDADHVDSIRR